MLKSDEQSKRHGKRTVMKKILTQFSGPQIAFHIPDRFTKITTRKSFSGVTKAFV